MAAQKQTTHPLKSFHIHSIRSSHICTSKDMYVRLQINATVARGLKPKTEFKL